MENVTLFSAIALKSGSTTEARIYAVVTKQILVQALARLAGVG